MLRLGCTRKRASACAISITDTVPQRAATLPALPGRTRLRPDVSALARPAARHGQPDHDRLHRKVRPRPGAIRAQDDQLKVAEKTSVLLSVISKARSSRRV